MLDLHIGNSSFLENTFMLGQSRVRYTATDDSTGSGVALDGALHLRQLTGGLRKALPWTGSSDHQFFGRVGSGWAWYSLSDVSVGGSRIGEITKGGYAPSVLPSRRSWPNFLYTGVGYEFFSGRPKWIAKTYGYGLRVDANWMVQRLTAGEVGGRRDIWASRGDLGLKATIGW